MISFIKKFIQVFKKTYKEELTKLRKSKSNRNKITNMHSTSSNYMYSDDSSSSSSGGCD